MWVYGPTKSRRWVAAATLATGLLSALFLFSPDTVGAQTPLTRLAEPGPWPGISRIIAFDGGIWFVNSEPLARFNAADIYRYDPETRTARYERGLFSQHAGTPVVYGGRLYWPFEDPRSNAALGEYALTDGHAWQWQTMADVITLNVHAMGTCGDALVAGTGGWEGALQFSRDGAEDWRVVFRLPDNKDGLGHITALGNLGQRCFFGVTAWGTTGPKLFEWNAEGAAPVPGWPDGERVSAITVFKGALYALNDAPGGRSLWRYDGDSVERIPFPVDSLPRDLAATESHLLAISSDAAGGALWRSEDGASWSQMQLFDGERPIDLEAVSTDAYVGTYRDDGRGALWGPAAPTVAAPGPGRVALAPPPETQLEEEAAQTTLRPLETVLGSKSDYMTFRAALLGIAVPVARTHAPIAGVLLAKRARKPPLPDDYMISFDDHPYSSGALGRWLLLYAAGINGHGWVEPVWLSAPWNAEPRPSEKYLDIQLMAIWTAGRLGQSSAGTMDALIGRFDQAGDPDWLKGDVVAALTAITNNHFGHDLDAWKAWWQGARPSWPQE